MWNIRGYYDRGKIVGNISLFPLSFISQFVNAVGVVGNLATGEVIVILARCKFHFIREHENLVSDPSINKCIVQGTIVQNYYKLYI